ncbi:leucine-rich repeat protein, partial [Bacteroides xylanisolvens]
MNEQEITFNKERTEIVIASNVRGAYDIPFGIHSINVRAFVNCTEMTSIHIPDSVQKIWHCAFDNCSSLTEVIIPHSVIYIGQGAFSDCIYNHRTTKTNQKYPS